MDPVKAWHAEHEYFRRFLALLHENLEAVPSVRDPLFGAKPEERLRGLHRANRPAGVAAR